MRIHRHHIINAVLALSILAGIAYNLPDAIRATAATIIYR